MDSHAGSIATARKRAQEAGVANRVRFETARAKGLEGRDFDLVCFFDCLHDLGDPVGAAKRARGALRKGGTLMVVEPSAGDKVEENLHPLGRLYYSASTFLCTPNSLSQEVGLALGAQAWRGAAHQGAARCRVHQGPAGDPHAVQHDPGGKGVMTAPSGGA